MKKILLWCTMLITSWAFAQNTVQLGSGTGSSSFFPNYYYYNYSYSQTIYTAAEMTAQGAVAGDITKIRYKPTASVATTNWKDWVIYMTTSSKSTFSSKTDWIPVGNMTKVFDSTIPASITANEWMELTLSSAFT
ncbi:MAG: hypothetical protein JST62_00050, partial [Bacteroidetes bacterium]|nr:hypothetical protein [Bacteroidota bacterium]